MGSELAEGRGWVEHSGPENGNLLMLGPKVPRIPRRAGGPDWVRAGVISPTTKS